MTETIVVAAVSAFFGGLISFILQFIKFKQEIHQLKMNHKTEFMAEDTAIHFLSHKGYTDRSFETLRERLGGFEDDELRKILVRAGAVRVFKEGKEPEEWWRLLSRMDEYIEKKRQD